MFYDRRSDKFLSAEEVLELTVKDFCDFSESSRRLENVLLALGKKKIRDILILNDNDFLKIPAFGKKTLEELKKLLSKNDIHIGMTEEEVFALRSREPL